MYYYTLAFKKYKQCDGRASRTEYWMFVLLNNIVLAGLMLLKFLMNEDLLSVVPIIYVFAVIVPNFAITCRRLHDTGRSSWWILISLVPYVGYIVLLIFLCLPGEIGINSYGAPRVNISRDSPEVL